MNCGEERNSFTSTSHPLSAQWLDFSRRKTKTKNKQTVTFKIQSM